MNRRFFMVLSIVILIGIQPVFAQEDASAKATAEEEDTSTEVIAGEENTSTEVIAGEESTPSEAIAGEKGTSSKAIAGKKAVRTEKVIDMELASDKEFKEALEASLDIELVNKNNAQSSDKKSAAPAEKSAAKKPAATKKTVTNTEQKASGSISNNEHLQESQRLADLAEGAYNEGDYDASAGFAEAAIRSAELSDEYIAEQTGISVKDGPLPLPASYTVRAWGVSQDCFWNIAGRPWVYGNSRQWRTLYNANKAKLPDPNNPNLIEPGIVLDIPSLKGEVREGAWDKDKTYTPLQ